MGTYKQFTGSAVVGHLTAAITGTPASFTVDNSTGFPTGAGSVPFTVTVDRGTSTEEKILCSSQGSGVFTIQTRGWDGTSSQNHSNGATVEHTIDADTLNDVEQHVHVTTQDNHTQYLLTTGARTNTGLTGATAASRYAGATTSGAPTTGTFAVGDFVIDQTGVVWVCTVAGTPGTWGQIGPAAGATDSAWTNVSTFTNSWTSLGGSNSAVGFRKVNGRVYLRGAVHNGTLGQAAFTLPAGYQPSAEFDFAVSGALASSGTTAITVVRVSSAGVVTPFAGTNQFADLSVISFDTL